MARARNLKPSFFSDDKLAELEPLARILFAGLWCIADRAGRLEDRPKRIKIEVLPYDDVDAERLLGELAAAGFIARYAVGDARYIQVRRFARHQNPHVKEPTSTIPAPDTDGASPVLEPDKAPDQHSSRPADSLSLDSLSLDSLSLDSGFLIPSLSPPEPGASPDTATPAPSDREMAVLKDLQVKGLDLPAGNPVVQGWLRDYSDDVIERGIDRAAHFKNGGGLNLGYVSSVLADPSWRTGDRMRDMLAELGIAEDWDNSDDGVIAAARVLRLSQLTQTVTSNECKRRLRDELKRRFAEWSATASPADAGDRQGVETEVERQARIEANRQRQLKAVADQVAKS